MPFDQSPDSSLEPPDSCRSHGHSTLIGGSWHLYTQLDELGLSAAASIDVLTRRNGTHDGTILISEK